MEKILLAFDSAPADLNAIEFACQIAGLTQARLIGVFLEEPATEEVLIEQETDRFGNTVFSITEPDKQSEQEAQQEENISVFKEWAFKKGLRSSVYQDKGIASTDLIQSSRYADVLILNADAFSQPDEALPSAFVKNILHDSACPVILSPEGFESVDNIVFCYDGSKSSLFAIRQFSYLFPQLRSQRLKIINLNAKESSEQEEERLMEWLKYHYSDVEWITENPDAVEALFHYLLRKRNDFVVMGPYGHGLLASFFEPDKETGIIRTTSLPIFVAQC